MIQKALCGKNLTSYPGDTATATNDPADIVNERTCERCLQLAAGKSYTSPATLYIRPRESWSFHVQR